MLLPTSLLQTRNETVGPLAMLYSSEGLPTFTEMANNSFRIRRDELTAEETRALLFLLNVSEQIGAVAAQDLHTLGLMPVVVLKGLTSANAQLLPNRTLLADIEAGRLSPLEAKIQAGEIAIKLRLSCLGLDSLDSASG